MTTNHLDTITQHANDQRPALRARDIAQRLSLSLRASYALMHRIPFHIKIGTSVRLPAWAFDLWLANECLATAEVGERPTRQRARTARRLPKPPTSSLREARDWFGVDSLRR